MENFTENKKARKSSILAAFRLVCFPLIQAMAESRGALPAEGEGQDFDGKIFSSLIENTINLSRELGIKFEENENELETAIKWSLAGVASQVVAANYKATGKTLSRDEIKHLSELAYKTQQKFKIEGHNNLQKLSNTGTEFRSRIMEAMIPVVNAVAQYSFGRAEHALLAEVAEQLVKAADQVTRALAVPGATPEEWRVLYWNILRAAGYIYSESHYAEADRLLYMNPEERAALFAKHDNIVPMTQVWQSFRQRMAMLATLAMYLEVPESEEIERQAWS